MIKGKDDRQCYQQCHHCFSTITEKRRQPPKALAETPPMHQSLTATVKHWIELSGSTAGVSKESGIIVSHLDECTMGGALAKGSCDVAT